MTSGTHQTVSSICDYIISKQDLFISKLQKSSEDKWTKNDGYYIWGTPIKIDEHNNLIYPDGTIINTDHKQQITKKERQIMLDFLEDLKRKYRSNPYVDISKITFKTTYMKTRFGSCNARKHYININLHLLQVSQIYTEYVFLHEITHLNVQNHSIEFYRLFEQLCPNYKIYRKELKQLF